MAKRKETVMLEKALQADTRQKRLYGSEEITIGFFKNGLGHEVVDFMTMDTSEVFRCYEIKVTMQDLKSSAKKSFYGHYNYLVITPELWEKIVKSDMDLTQYGIPKHVGIITGGSRESHGYVFYDLHSVRKATRIDITAEQKEMLKSSIIRSLYWKMEKFRSESDGTLIKELKQELSREKRRAKEEKEERERLYWIIKGIESGFRQKYGERIRVLRHSSSGEIISEIESYFKDIIIPKWREEKKI